MSTTLEQLQYGFDRDSRRTWRQRATTQGWDNAYAYDSLSQVAAGNLGTLNMAHSAIAGIPSAGSRWQYDETGNWHGYQTLADGSIALTQERTHDKGNRLMDVSGAAMMRTDRVGRITATVPGPGGDWSSSYQITWDAWSRITGVASVDDATVTPMVTYAYDGLTRRITRYSEATDMTLHSYYNDIWRPVEERQDSATTAAASYLWGSRHRDDLVRRDRAVGGTTLNETRYVLMDYFSPASITDETGAVTERYQFSPFGLRTILNPDYTVRSDSECALEFAFHGQFCDVETGWYNYGYRYYLPALGRWACKDPIMEAGGYNLYSITSNDAVNQVDLLGLDGAPATLGGPPAPSDCDPFKLPPPYTPEPGSGVPPSPPTQPPNAITMTMAMAGSGSKGAAGIPPGKPDTPKKPEKPDPSKKPDGMYDPDSGKYNMNMSMNFPPMTMGSMTMGMQMKGSVDGEGRSLNKYTGGMSMTMQMGNMTMKMSMGVSGNGDGAFRMNSLSTEVGFKF